MSTRSMKTRLLALVVAFMMVMSIASVAFAEKSKKVTVKYDRNGGTLTGVSSATYQPFSYSNGDRDAKITFTLAPASVASRSGYIFTGWKIGSNYYDPGEEVTLNISRSSGSGNWSDVTVYAQWAAIDTTADVRFYNNPSSSSSYGGTSSVTPGSGTSASVSVTMKSTPTAGTGVPSGHTSFAGFNVYLGSKTGTLVASNVAAGSTISVSLSRSSTSDNWPDIYVVGQWQKPTYIGETMSHVDVRVPASVRVVTKLDGEVTSDVTYSATVLSATGTINGSTLSFPSSPNSSNEFRANKDFRHYLTNVVDLTVTLRVNLGGGETRTITAPLSYTGAALQAAVDECPGSGSSKGYDIIIAVEDISEAFTHEVKFLTTTGGTLSGTTTFSGILHDTAWSAAVTEPGKNPGNGYVFDGWYDEQNNKVTSFPAKVIEDRTFTAKWTALADVTQKYYSVTYKLDGNNNGDYNDPEDVITNAFVDVTAMPITVAADASKQGYTFAGWFKQGTTTKLTALVAGNYDLNSSRTVVIPAGPGTAKITKEYYEITLTGTLTKKTSQKTVYSVFYSGEHEGATFWPASVNNATTPPTIAGPGTKVGYTFSGWNPSSLDWSADYVVVNTDAEIYEAASDTFLTVTRKTITVTGSFTQTPETVNTYYTVIYNIDLNGDNDYNDAGETAIAYNEVTTMPDTVYGEPAGVPQGFKFDGWSKTAPLALADYTKVYDQITTPSTQPGVGDVRTVKYELVILGTISENEHETQTYYNLKYQINGTYTHPDGSALTPANVPGDQLNVAETAPTVSGTLPTMNGHTFSGWSALNWGTPVHTTDYNPSTNAIIDIYTYTATVQGSFSVNTVIENKYYSLNYSIEGTYKSADNATLIPTKPANVTDKPDSKPSLEAGHYLEGHSFAGWKQGGSAVTDSTLSFPQVGSTTYELNANNQYVATSYYAADVVGAYTYNGVDEKSLYNLAYTGDSDLADAGTWPADVSNSSSAPTLAAPLTKQGYDFIGWKQGDNVVTSVTWAVVSTSYRLNDDNKYEKTTTYSATVNGVFEKHGSVNEYIYIVHYSVTGGESSYSDLDVNVTNPATPPAIAADLNESGKVFSGWTPGSLNWDGVTAVVVNDARYENGKWVNTHTKTINVSGSFGTIEHVNVYELTFTGPAGATLPGMKSSTGSAPSIGSEEASLAGHRFDGWNPASVSVGDYVENTGRLTTSTDGLTVTHYFEASTEAQFVQTGENHVYTMHYVLTGDVAGRPTDFDVTQYNGEFLPDNSNVPATIGDYYFAGWSITAPWAVTSTTGPVDVNGVEVTTYYHEATATGLYTNMEIKPGPTKYTLIYEGYVSGALFWPADVIKSETPPTLAGAPYLAGYTFSGWTPGALDWSSAAVTTSYEIVYPGEGEGEPYLLTIITNTVRVRGNFVQDEIPGEPEDPEIPLGAPQTGSVEMLSFGFAFVALGAAVMTATVIRRRKNNEADGE